MPFIKNIEHEQALNISNEISAAPGQVVSKTLVQNEAVSITLFSFSKGEEISTHSSKGDAMVLVLEGKGRFTIDGNEHFVSSGETIVMPAGKPHAVFAAEDFKMMLTVVFEGSKS